MATPSKHKTSISMPSIFFAPCENRTATNWSSRAIESASSLGRISAYRSMSPASRARWSHWAHIGGQRTSTKASAWLPGSPELDAVRQQQPGAKFEPRRQVVKARCTLRVGRQQGSNQRGAKPFLTGPGDLRPTHLSPGEIEQPGEHCRVRRPAHFDLACMGSEGAVLACVGGQLVHGESKTHGWVWSEPDIGPPQQEAIAAKWSDHGFNDRGQARTLTSGLHENVMRACHGMHATDQQGFKLIERGD